MIVSSIMAIWNWLFKTKKIQQIELPIEPKKQADEPKGISFDYPEGVPLNEVIKKQNEKEVIEQLPILFIIDAGHGINTQGKRTPDFDSKGTHLKEWEFNIDVANKCIDLCHQKGIETFLVNPEKNDVPLSERYKRINSATLIAKKEGKRVVLLSIHADAHQPNFPKLEWTSANGCTVFYYRSNDKSKVSIEGRRLATAIQRKLVERTGLTNRSWTVERANSLGANFGILRETLPVGCLVECAFMTNKTEANLLLTNSFRQTCAQAIVDATLEYLEI